MSFFSPHSLAFSLLVALIAAMYVARWIRSQRAVSTMLLWERAFARRNRWRRWQRLISASSLCVILLLMVVALAHPYWTALWQSKRNIVVIVDTSAGMNATDVAPTRLASGCRAALRLVDGLQRYDRMAVLSAGGMVKVHCGLTDDKSALEKALGALRPTDGGDMMPTAVRLARQIVADVENRQIVLVTDGCFEGAGQLVAADDIQVLVTPVADDRVSASNVGITALAARASPVDPQMHEVFIEVANFASQRSTSTLQVGLGNGALISEKWQLDPNERRSRVFEMDLSAGGLLTASWELDDQLLADNRASLLIAPRAGYRIQVIAAAPSADALAAENYLRAGLQALPAATVENVAATADRDAPPGTIHVFTGAVPERLPDGPVLTFAPRGSCQLWQSQGMVDGPHIVARSEEASAVPFLDGVDLRSVVVDALLQADYTQPPDIVLKTEGGLPVISAWETASGRVLLVHMPLEQSDFTRRRAFPLFLAQAVRWLAGRGDRFQLAVTTRDTIALNATKAIAPLRLRSPAGTLRTLGKEQSLVGPLVDVGIWRIEQFNDESDNELKGRDSPVEDREPADSAAHDSGTLRVVAVNLLDARESDLRPDAGFAAAAPVAPMEDADAEPPWGFLVLAALVLLIAEWVLYQRKVLI